MRNRVKCNFRFSIVIFVLLLTNIVDANAQILKAANPTRKSKVLPKIYAGVKLGSNFSYLSGKTWENGIKSNMLGGIYAGIKGAGFGAQIEGLFEQSDYKTSDKFYSLYKSYFNDIKDSLKNGTFRVNKLSLPVVLQFRIARLLWLQTGLQFYGIVNVKDNADLVRDAKTLFKSGNRAAIIGATMHIGNADIGLRTIIDFQNLNNLSTDDVWRQYLFQAHVGIKLF